MDFGFTDPVQQVRHAYGDLHGLGHRDLDMATDYLDLNTAISAVIEIGSYNRFDSSRVEDLLMQADRIDPAGIRVAVGREGSPVLYIETGAPDEVARVFRGYADEVDVVSRSERHRDRRPGLLGEFGVGGAGGGAEVVRAWWD